MPVARGGTSNALEHLGVPFDLSGGGSDLVFPHHEMSAAQSVALGGGDIFAHHYAHQAMVGLDGEKMSKSKGNLVFVSTLRFDGVDPMVIRLVLLDHHHATDWEFTDDQLTVAPWTVREPIRPRREWWPGRSTPCWASASERGTSGQGVGSSPLRRR